MIRLYLTIICKIRYGILLILSLFDQIYTFVICLPFIKSVLLKIVFFLFVSLSLFLLTRLFSTLQKKAWINKSWDWTLKTTGIFQHATIVLSHLSTIFTNDKQRENILLEITIPVNFFFIKSVCIATMSLRNLAILTVIGFGRKDSLRNDIGDSGIPINRHNLMKN